MRDIDAPDTTDTASTETDLLAARLAAVERALGARACDCAHDAFERPDPPTPAPPDSPAPSGAPDVALRTAVRALCEYVLACERADSATNERATAVEAALDRLEPSSAGDDPSSSDDTSEASSEPTLGARAWLERVTAATFE